ncbi:hypothetical protein HZB00_03865 [Candidatus Woesearchaeota archaeon]|nr:hypothetical protein [Candidatus Woesearchaeota archaeon]
MYLEFETKTSYKYLQEVINALEEPICILGGWAIFFHVHKNFQKAQGRPYLGSRDIDLGFHLDKDATMEQMKKSALAKSLSILENKLKFKSVSFRLVKEIHTETEEEIGEGKIIPSHFIFPMYIDLLVDFIPKSFNELFKFNPADEPLLAFAFNNSNNRTELNEFNKKLLLPNVGLLLATKINALSLRDKEHKKIKDVCDIFALLWYSEKTNGRIPKREPSRIPERLPMNPLKELAKNVRQFIPTKKIKDIINTIIQEDYKKASNQLNHSPEEIKRVIELLVE